MMYPFLTLDDGTEIVHSETKPDGRVKVYIERPDAKDCFHHATCWLPGYEWEDVSGFSPSEITRLEEVVRSVAQCRFIELAEHADVQLPDGWRFDRTECYTRGSAEAPSSAP